MKKAQQALQFFREWKHSDFVAGVATGAALTIAILIVYGVKIQHLWDMLRFYWVDMLLTGLAAFAWMRAHKYIQDRGMPALGQALDKWTFIDRNWFAMAMLGAGGFAAGLVDPEIFNTLVLLLK